MAFRNPLQQLPGTTVPASGIIGQIQGSQIQAGTITANEVAAGVIDGKTINSNTINGATINGGTITGTTVRTAANGMRWEMDSWGADGLRGYTADASESAPGLLVIGSQLFNSGFSIAGLFSSLASPQGSGGARASLMLSASPTGAATSAVIHADNFYAPTIDADYLNVAGVPYSAGSSFKFGRFDGYVAQGTTAVIAHGLGTVPSAVVISLRTGSTNQFALTVQASMDSYYFYVVARRYDLAALASTPASFDWVAYR